MYIEPQGTKFDIVMIFVGESCDIIYQNNVAGYNSR